MLQIVTINPKVTICILKLHLNDTLEFLNNDFHYYLEDKNNKIIWVENKSNGINSKRIVGSKFVR